MLASENGTLGKKNPVKSVPPGHPPWASLPMRALSLAHCSIKSAHAEMERQSTKRRSSHERHSKKSQVVLSKMDGMKHECSKLRDISLIFLRGVPLPDIKVVEVFIPKTPRELCSFGCLLCIITYPKKKIHLKNPSSFASPNFTPPAVVGCFHPSFLGTSLASTSSAHNAACCVTSTSAKAKRASKGSCRDNCPLRKSGSWSRHGVVWLELGWCGCMMVFGGKRCGIFWGVQI